jgi:hypothetical protein
VIRVTIASAAVALLAAITLGLVQPTLTIDEEEEEVHLWCVFNNWEHRKIVLEKKRIGHECSIPGTFGGRWYCICK